MRRTPTRCAVVTLVVVCLAARGGAAAATTTPWFDPTPPQLDTHDLPVRPDPAAAVRYQLPAERPVRRGFVPPSTLFGPGHRGVDLEVAPGEPVRSSAAGVVSFAGTVAGLGWVTVAHADGVLTSYGPVVGVRVRRGESVTRGQELARLATGGHGDGGRDHGLHWGARRDGRYLDPLTLLDRGTPRPSLVGTGAWRGIDHAVVPYDPWVGGTWGGLRVGASPVAQGPGFAVAPGPNHLVMVGGLGSSTTSRLVDPEHLGYDEASVTRYSYAGLDPASAGGEGVARGQLRYGPEHTWLGIDAAAAELAALLRAQAAREPGRAVDLVGHSMGGLVILRYLTREHDPYDPTLPPIATVVTIASPHDGSDVATVGARLRDNRVLGPALDGARQLLTRFGGRLGREAGHLPLDVPAVDQLRVGSQLTAELARDWEAAAAAGTAGPLAMGTRVLTIGAAGDMVVPVVRSDRPAPDAAYGALWDARVEVEHRVLPGGHSSVLETEAVREVVWRFLAGEEVVDSPGHAAQAGSVGYAGALQLLGEGIVVHGLPFLPLPRVRHDPTPLPPG